MVPIFNESIASTSITNTWVNTSNPSVGSQLQYNNAIDHGDIMSDISIDDKGCEQCAPIKRKVNTNK